MMRWRIGRRSLGALALLFGLIAGYAHQPAEAQVTFTQITNSTGTPARSNGGLVMNNDGTRIAFVSYRDLTGGNPDSNYEIFLWTQGSGISQAGSTITVTGTGFSSATVINLFNAQPGGVVNLGDLNPDGSPKIPLTVPSSTQFSFAVPAGAVPGPAFIQAINPPLHRLHQLGGRPRWRIYAGAVRLLTVGVTY
jgi:hypothetical protein